MNKIKQYFEDKRGKKSAVKRYTRSKAGNFALVFFLVAGGLFSMLPLIYCVSTSFKPLDELLIFPPRFFVHRPTIGNYTILPDLMASLKVPLSRYVANSIGITLLTTFVYILVALMAAYAISKGTFKGRNAIFWTVQFALMFNAYTLAVPQYLIFSKLGLIDTYWIYILPPMASTMGVFLGKQYIEGYVPDALLEAAKIDGANQFKVFWSIVMPTIKPIWLTLLLFTFRDIWAMVPSGKIFSEELKILPQVVTQITAGGTARAGSAMAVTVIMMIPPIIVFLVSQSSVAESMSSAGIKE
ncbi:MAG: carbohydrate ABC transporter permease [Ruminococcaceae bacterium]|nr:carbohydrate ABC transporter permease [Oscillospiraceae bacterium]